jgi:hypothetical protein
MVTTHIRRLDALRQLAQERVGVRAADFFDAVCDFALITPRWPLEVERWRRLEMMRWPMSLQALNQHR